jgi:hypothetical protein
MSREEHGNRTTWRMRTRDIASALMGARDTARMVTTLLHKRDLGAVWEVDPVAAPPRYVQQRILGTPEAPDRPVALLPRPDDERHVGADPASFEERRSVLELQLRFAMERRDVERSRQISRELRSLSEQKDEAELACARARNELHVGHTCYALGKLVEWQWYRARLVQVRTRWPPLRIEYVSTMEGDASRLALPAPHVNFLPLEHVRLDAPEPDDDPVLVPQVACVLVPELLRIDRSEQMRS